MGCFLLIIVQDIFQKYVKNESDLQCLHSYIVAIMPSFILGYCFYHFHKIHGSTQVDLESVDLEEVVTANLLPYVINHSQNNDLESTSGEVDNNEF